MNNDITTYDPGIVDEVDLEEWSTSHSDQRAPECRRYRIRIDKGRFTIGGPMPTGRELLALVGKESQAWRLVQRFRGGCRHEVGPDEAVDVRAPGVERFKTRARFAVCIEGTIHPWSRPVITTEEIAALGGWDPSVGVIEVNKDGDERTLTPGEEVRVRPGLAYGKKLCWKRG